MNQIQVQAIIRGESLKRLITEHDHAYYTLGQPTISDAEYDRLYAEYESLEKQYPELCTVDSPTQRVGGELLAAFEKFTHLSPLLSIDQKSKSSEALVKWYEDCGGDGTEILIQPKLDGITINNYYEDGLYQLAATRGNGYIGELVTKLVQLIRSVPMRIPFEGRLELRGEAVAPYHYFKENFSQEYSNPRNFVAGTMRQLDPNLVKARRPEIIFYDLGVCDRVFDTDSEQLAFIESLGFKTAPYLVVSTVAELVAACEAKMNGQIETLDGFNIMTSLDAVCDGLVLKVNNLAKREQLGMTSKGPKFYFAYKFDSLSEVTTLKKVEYQVGRTGRITQVANFKKISLGGTSITRATLNNVAYIQELGLKLGSEIVIERANDVIPRVIGLADSDEGKGKDILFPSTCPCCETPLVEKHPLHFCPNVECPDRLRGMINLFASRDAMNVTGLGSSVADILVSMGWVHRLSDLFTLKENHEQDLLGLDGFGRKKVDKLFESIEACKQVEAWRVLYSLGIENVGRRMSKELFKHFDSIPAILNASTEDLLRVPDLGPSIVEAIQEAKISLEASGELARLAQYLKFQVEAKEEGGTHFAGLSFVITGTLQEKRHYYQEIIEAQGGKVSGSVSKKTNVVLVGADAGSKEDKARELIEKGAPITLLESHEAFISYCLEMGLSL